MFSVRRYAVYLGVAAFVLFALHLLRGDRISGIYSGKHANQGLGHLAGGKFRWDQVPVRFPVKTLTPLPTSPARRLPKVQFDFQPESEDQRATRENRRATVKAAFERCWQAYREHAWMRDELAPLTGGYKNTFGGWAATLVDNLDTLWIMDLKPEFDEAVAAAVSIDLGKVGLDRVNVFETTIRHLGGLLASYDLSGDERLLEKAKEFGDMLIVPFDTPNRMPITRWSPRDAFLAPQSADRKVIVAEIGSLTLEFTRLSQITGDPKWYDAVERISRMFADQQSQTHLSGMWPLSVDAKNQDLTQDTHFTLSAMSDSLYEYFPKMHALLGGVEEIYQKMYEDSMSTAIKYNLFRPMLPDDADVLISGNVRASDRRNRRLDPQGQHLVCFAGGMFALGGKLFNKQDHVEIGKKLTDGCIWTYRSSGLPLKIMPEIFHMVPCEDRSSCHWNETRWREDMIFRQRARGRNDDFETLITRLRLPKGFTDIHDTRYILRPEAIESVFILYRITGESYLQEAAWEMFTAIMTATKTPLANAALSDVTLSPEQLATGNTGGTTQMDGMESFWMAETLKYFYLIFSEPDMISLDEYVL